MKIIETDWKWKTSFKNRTSTKYIVLHHAAVSKCTAADIHRGHQEKGWAGIGYHFFVRKDGSIYRGRPIGAVGAHCLGWNEVSIGICAEGNFQTDIMPDAQKFALADLVSWLRFVYPEAKVVGHKEMMATSCPGQNYPLEELKEEKKMVEAWKQTIIDEALQKGLITEPHEPDEPAPKWFVLAVVLNGMKK